MGEGTSLSVVQRILVNPARMLANSAARFSQSTSVAASFVLLGVAMAVPAGAVSAPARPQVIEYEYIKPSASDLSARCRKSELTQERFLQMLHAIVLHGDLTDVPFIEKTLRLELQQRRIFIPPGHVDYSRYARKYFALSLLNAPIIVQLDVVLRSSENATNKEPTYKQAGTLDFESLDRVASDFQNCDYVTKDQINREFGGGFSETIFPDGFGWLSASKRFDVSKIMGAVVTVNYVYRTDTGAIAGLQIQQR